MTTITKILKNQRGDMSYFTAFFMIAINMLILMLLIYFSVYINVANIKSSAKMELNNLSARIASDTYSAQREGNLDAYIDTLYANSSYQTELKNTYIDGLTKSIDLENQNYKITNMDLTFEAAEDRIQYQFSCDVNYYINILGEHHEITLRNIQLTGYHITKY